MTFTHCCICSGFAHAGGLFSPFGVPFDVRTPLRFVPDLHTPMCFDLDTLCFFPVIFARGRVFTQTLLPRLGVGLDTRDFASLALYANGFALGTVVWILVPCFRPAAFSAALATPVRFSNWTRFARRCVCNWIFPSTASVFRCFSNGICFCVWAFCVCVLFELAGVCSGFRGYPVILPLRIHLMNSLCLPYA